MVSEQQRIQTAKTVMTSRRNYRRCRDRALARLSNNHREEYLELLEEERIRDVKEGKAWVDLSGRTNYGLDSDGSALVIEPRETTQSADKGNL